MMEKVNYNITFITCLFLYESNPIKQTKYFYSFMYLFNKLSTATLTCTETSYLCIMFIMYV